MPDKPEAALKSHRVVGVRVVFVVADAVVHHCRSPTECGHDHMAVDVSVTWVDDWPSAQASTIRARRASDSRSPRVSTSGASLGLGIRQAYYLQGYLCLRTLVAGDPNPAGAFARYRPAWGIVVSLTTVLG